ncbi:hypothetical protein CVD19_02325 [Bacillus sp. T33-2]|nr:hypothetical protein CVD19_02325 [Bacillus sp. T33-2]
MKNRSSIYFFAGIVILSAIGIVSRLINNPVGFLQTIAGMVLIVGVIFLLVRRFSSAHPGKQEQRAFLKAAKKSKKRFHHKEPSVPPRRSTIGSLATARKKKKDASHLTVIEGKKGKKKNRASF